MACHILISFQNFTLRLEGLALYNNRVRPVRRVSTLLTLALPHHFTKRGGSVLYNKLRPATFN
jgi:hypothetical protein